MCFTSSLYLLVASRAPMLAYRSSNQPQGKKLAAKKVRACESAPAVIILLSKCGFVYTAGPAAVLGRCGWPTSNRKAHRVLIHACEYLPGLNGWLEVDAYICIGGSAHTHVHTHVHTHTCTHTHVQPASFVAKGIMGIDRLRFVYSVIHIQTYE